MPVELTEEMLSAYEALLSETDGFRWRGPHTTWRCLLSAAPQPPQSRGWQEMETAPKEHGRAILIAYDCPHMMAVVEWLDASIVMDAEFVSGWYISDGHNDPIWFRANPYMTHWMPLPEPPVG